MNESILTNVKKVLGLAEDYTAFDEDVILFINSAFSVLNQLGIGPDDGFMIQDATAVWSDITYVDQNGATGTLPMKWMNMVKTYIYLRSKREFDPASTRFVIDAVNSQIQEHEVRLSVFRDEIRPVPKPVREIVYLDVFTGSEETI